MLVQYDAPHFCGEVRGAEAAWRSKYVLAATPVDVGAPVFHPHLTVKFAIFAAASVQTKALQGDTFDKAGGKAEVMPKRAKANRRPHMVRRREALAPFWSNPAETWYHAVNESTQQVRELVTIQWDDDPSAFGKDNSQRRQECRQGPPRVGGGREHGGRGGVGRAKG